MTKHIPWPLFAALLLVLAGCFKECPEGKYPNTTAYYDMPDSIRALLPYQDGDTVYFRSPQENILPFHTARNSTWYDDERVEVCNTDHFYYEEALVRMQSLVSGLDIGLELSIFSHKDLLELSVNRNYFEVCSDPGLKYCAPMIDSVWVNGAAYHEVYVLTPYDRYEMGFDYLPVDTVLFNFTSGILEIVLPGGERYRLEP